MKTRHLLMGVFLAAFAALGLFVSLCVERSFDTPGDSESVPLSEEILP